VEGEAEDEVSGLARRLAGAIERAAAE
jgi:hypothetical protein